MYQNEIEGFSMNLRGSGRVEFIRPMGMTAVGRMNSALQRQATHFNQGKSLFNYYWNSDSSIEILVGDTRWIPLFR